MLRRTTLPVTTARVVAVALALALALLAAGCGGSSGRSAARSTTSSSEALDPSISDPTASSSTTVVIDPTTGLPVTTTTAPPATTASTRPATVTTARPATTARPVTTTAKPATTASTTAAGDPAQARVALRQVTSLQAPDVLVPRDGDTALYAAERAGRVRRIVNGQVAATPVLDISSETDTTGERGLLGLAFAPGGAQLYVDMTTRDGTIHILEFTMQGTTAGNRRELLAIPHGQFSNHNGGQLAFGPDGMLYIAVGDGGGSGDPNNNGQSLGTLLGKILRIDPRASGSAPYGIPPDNPFVARAGARGEIWAYGLRNPWRFSFDRQTGDLWIADVGQNLYEEINLARAGSKGGENYGWKLREGTHPFNNGARPADNVEPVYDYDHSGGECSVTGGYVYRGTAIPALRGSYLFGDFCTGDIRALVLDNGRGRAVDLNLRVDNLASFGQDQAGEIYALSLTGAVFQLAPR